MMISRFGGPAAFGGPRGADRAYQAAMTRGPGGVLGSPFGTANGREPRNLFPASAGAVPSIQPGRKNTGASLEPPDLLGPVSAGPSAFSGMGDE